jgi:anaerobic sulfite reductase subunit A
MSKRVRNETGLTGKNALSLEDLRMVNLSREKLYAFLSRLFAKEVDAETLTTITAVQPAIDLLASSQETREFEDGSRLLQEFIAETKALPSEGREGLIKDLRAEFAGLFLAVGFPYRRKEHLLTCESAFSGKYRTYYDRPYLQVRNLYRRSGFEKRKDFLEPEDHIAVELDYMANLCKQTHLSLEDENFEDASRYLQLQKGFLRDHLLKWVPQLCKSLKEGTESKLYKSLAHLTNGFTSMEEQVVDELGRALEPLAGKKGGPQTR